MEIKEFLETEELIWTTALGESKRLSEMSQQHLSNIIWFNKVFNNRTWVNCPVMATIMNRLLTKELFPDGLLLWKPLPIPSEIKSMCILGLIKQDGDIVFQGDIIGSISHIPDYLNIIENLKKNN